MRITIIGHMNGDASQNGVRIAQSWARQGNSIQCLDFNLYDHLTPIEKFNPNFILVTIGREFNPIVIKTLRDKGYFLANWYADEYGIGDAHGGEFFENIKGLYHLILCETRGIISGLQTNNIADEIIHIPQYYDPYYHKSTEKRLQVSPNFDLGFLGGPNIAQSTVRVKFLEQLVEENYDIKISGIPLYWKEVLEKGKFSTDKVFIQGPLINGDMARFYARTKIGLNFINDKLPKYELALSNRAMKTVGSGCFLLTQEVDGLEDMLTPGKHCETYPGTDYLALKEKIEFFLKNESIREQIAAQGKQHVLENYNIDKITAGFIKEIRKRM